MTDNNFLAVLLPRHPALAGHSWGKGCVRSWGSADTQGPHTHTLWPPAQRAPGSAGGSGAPGTPSPAGVCWSHPNPWSSAVPKPWG